MNQEDQTRIRDQVRDHYAGVARGDAADEPGRCGAGCCGTAGCGPAGSSTRLGYAAADLAALPAGADLGLGCGDPHAVAKLRPGETVLDLGSGGGLDCLLAARQVGPKGRVIGVDMTPEMIAKARENARRAGLENVDVRLGEIEHLPVEDEAVDVVLSNCVVNLSPDKPQVFREAFRALRPGGRLAIFDVVATGELPPALREQVAILTGCVAGAARVDEVTKMLAEAGFVDVRVDVREESRAVVGDWFPGAGAEQFVASASIEAFKPAATSCCGPSCCAATRSGA